MLNTLEELNVIPNPQYPVCVSHSLYPYFQGKKGQELSLPVHSHGPGLSGLVSMGWGDSKCSVTAAYCMF